MKFHVYDLHQCSRGECIQEVLDYLPSLADRVPRNTTSYTVEEIAEEIAEMING